MEDVFLQSVESNHIYLILINICNFFFKESIHTYHNIQFILKKKFQKFFNFMVQKVESISVIPMVIFRVSAGFTRLCIVPFESAVVYITFNFRTWGLSLVHFSFMNQCCPTDPKDPVCLWEKLSSSLALQTYFFRS